MSRCLETIIINTVSEKSYGLFYPLCSIMCIPISQVFFSSTFCILYYQKSTVHILTVLFQITCTLFTLLPKYISPYIGQILSHARGRNKIQTILSKRENLITLDNWGRQHTCDLRQDWIQELSATWSFSLFHHKRFVFSLSYVFFVPFSSFPIFFCFFVYLRTII